MKKKILIVAALALLTVVIVIWCSLFKYHSTLNLQNSIINNELPNIFLIKEKQINADNKKISIKENASFTNALDNKEDYSYDLTITSNKIVISLVKAPFFLKRKTVVLDLVDASNDKWTCFGFSYGGRMLKPCSEGYFFTFTNKELQIVK